jgi:CheY-like chemotaxis protein
VAAGVDAFLAKPFDPAELIRVVRELAGITGTTA